MSITIQFTDHSFSKVVCRPTSLSAVTGPNHYTYHTPISTKIKKRFHGCIERPLERIRQWMRKLRDSILRRPSASACERTKLAQSTKAEMTRQLMASPNKCVEMSSITEVESKSPSLDINKVKTQICVCNLTQQNQIITFEGEELQPVRLLPANGGVECHGQFVGQYRAATLDVIHAVTEYDANLPHIRKLVKRVLPTSLANNQKALNEYMKENTSDPNFVEMGMMTWECHRIKKEIESQKEKLKSLEANPIVVDSTQFVTYTYQTRVILPFGLTSLGGKYYFIVQVPSTDCIISSRLSEAKPATIMHPLTSPSN